MPIASYALISFSILAAVYAFFAYQALTTHERLSKLTQLALLAVIAGCIGYALIAHIEKTAIISAV